MSAHSRLQSLRKLLLTGCAAVFLSACATGSGTPEFIDTFVQSPDALADRALAALARGDYGAAEINILNALEKNPKHPYALLAGGILYQNTNRPLKARTMYEDLLSLQSPDMATVMGWSRMQSATLPDIARDNLRIMEGGQASPRPAGTGREAYSELAPVRTSQAVPATTLPARIDGFTKLDPPSSAAMVEALDPETKAIAARFRALQQLRDARLISPSEYAQRRSENIGGLLPMTKQAPANGLERPVPAIHQIMNRLEALQRSLQARAITPREHALERELILDALLPQKPEARALPRATPQGLLESAARIRQVEHLREMGLITADEAKAEQKAIEKALRASDSSLAVSDGRDRVAGGPQMLIPGGAKAAPEAIERPKVALADSITVHLSSYRSEGQAKRGWDSLRKRFPNQLGTLASDIRRVTVPNKGTFYRLHVGPMNSRVAADRLCSSLRRQRQFCTVSG